MIKDVILSTKNMMLLADTKQVTTEILANGFSQVIQLPLNFHALLTQWFIKQVALDAKKLIMIMFESETARGGEASHIFTKQFLTDSTKSLKNYVLNLIKACKVCRTNKSRVLT